MIESIIICLVIGLPIYGWLYQWKKASKFQKLLDKVAPLLDRLEEEEKKIESLTVQVEQYKDAIRDYEKKFSFYRSVPEIDMAITNALLHTKKGLYDISDKSIPDLSIRTDLTLNKPKKSLKNKDLSEDDINRLLDEMNNKQ